MQYYDDRTSIGFNNSLRKSNSRGLPTSCGFLSFYEMIPALLRDDIHLKGIRE